MRRQEELQSQSLVLPIFAAISVILFISLCWYAYNNFISGTKRGEAVYIKADKSPFKVKPSEEGGMKIAYKDKQIFNTITGTEEKLDSNVNVIKEEEPITKNKVISQSGSDATEKNVVDETGKDAEILLKNVKAKETKPEDAKKGDIILSQNNSDIQKLQDMKPAEEAEKTEEKKPAVTTAAKIETKKTDSGENKTKIVFDTPKSIVKPATPAGTTATGAFYVQVGAYGSNAEAETAWTATTKKLGNIVSGYTKRVTAATVNGKTYYRLAFGVFKSRTEATSKCAAIRTKGVNCLVQN